ncbi:MAG TPA: extracellular solute-binding protein [Firmicutes bacterium]|nr:extracellular solute-binding protein [Bacillota bacterium]
MKMRAKPHVRQVTMTMALVLMLSLIWTFPGLAKVPITMWLSSQPATVTPWAESFQDNFNKSQNEIELTLEVHPSVTLLREKLIVAMAAGVAPDLFYESNNVIMQWANSGSAIPLDKYIDNMPDRKDFIPDVLESMRYKGHIYGFPFSVWSVGDVYNLDLFVNSGVGQVNTWDEMIAAARKIRRENAAGQVEIWGYARSLNNALYDFIDLELAMNQLGTTMLPPEATKAQLNNDAGRRALNYIIDAKMAGMANTAAASTRLAEGKVAVQHMYAGYSLVNLAEAHKNINFSFRRYVGPEKGRDMIHFNAGTFMIVSTTKYPDQAWKVLEAFIKPENLKGYILAHGASLPSRISQIYDKDLQSSQYLQELVNTLHAPMTPYGPMHPYYTDVRIPAGELLSKAVTGESAPQAALEEAERLINQIIEEKMSIQ